MGPIEVLSHPECAAVHAAVKLSILILMFFLCCSVEGPGCLQATISQEVDAFQTTVGSVLQCTHSSKKSPSSDHWKSDVRASLLPVSSTNRDCSLNDEVQAPKHRTFQGAVLVADISGFTHLTESLGSRGTAGVEILTKCINNFFGRVIELVLSHGGDIMRFAGDSIICAFAATDAERAAADEGLASATLRAVRCASVLSEQLGSCI